MTQQQHAYKARWLWGLAAVGLIYSYLLYLLRSLTGIPLLDGSLGVILGLYICSHPAANAVDLIFSGRAFHRAGSGWQELGWLTLNLLVLLLGLIVIVIGAMRFVD